jgi:hypothetical protein
MTNKEFVKSVYPTAHCLWRPGKTECLIISYPNTIIFGILTQSRTPKAAWKKAANILRELMLKKLENT